MENCIEMYLKKLQENKLFKQIIVLYLQYNIYEYELKSLDYKLFCNFSKF